MAQFNLVAFTLYPTLEQFDECRKDDLLQIADFFNILVPAEASKRVVKKILLDELVQQGILPELGGSPSVAATPIRMSAVVEASSDDPGSAHRMDLGDPRSTREDLLLTIKLRELELEIKRQEYQAQLLRVRAVEIEADKELELRRLSMGDQKPMPFPRKVPTPGTTPPAARSARDQADALDAPRPSPQSPLSSPVSPEIVPSTKDALISAQKEDPSLEPCRVSAMDKPDVKEHPTAYFFRDRILMRQWSPSDSPFEWATVFQVVVLRFYRDYVLSLAHDHPCSGHLGIRKTLSRVLRYFYWPGVNSDVKMYCKTCHVCQSVGKPNQMIAPAPLHPIPVFREPFEHVSIDCVGPLPKTRSGNYLFTVMCAATRYPEAIPIRSLRTPVIVKSLIQFFTTFVLCLFSCVYYVGCDLGSVYVSEPCGFTHVWGGVTCRKFGLCAVSLGECLQVLRTSCPLADWSTALWIRPRLPCLRSSFRFVG
ncbi:uncharacterized protein [Paramormyrops kingsleyae]|uniref:uncharacterized protein n=1 Tax=Paramormyrops kingsleyae TaxID=1676925 RepID=UPI003B97A203